MNIPSPETTPTKPSRLEIACARGVVNSVGSCIELVSGIDSVSIDTFDITCKTQAEQLAIFLNCLLPRRTMEQLARELNGLISPGPKEKIVVRLPVGHDEETLKEFRDGFPHRYEVVTVIDPTMSR